MPLRTAFITIGQSPRSDLTPVLIERIGAGIDVTEYGALDELSAHEIERLAPVSNAPRPVTRLRNGEEAVIDKQ